MILKHLSSTFGHSHIVDNATLSLLSPLVRLDYTYDSEMLL